MGSPGKDETSGLPERTFGPLAMVLALVEGRHQRRSLARALASGRFSTYTGAGGMLACWL